jgi:trimeric autotransporter adhesin
MTRSTLVWRVFSSKENRVTDFATLVLGAETSGLRKGETDLDKLTAAGSRAEEAAESLREETRKLSGQAVTTGRSLAGASERMDRMALVAKFAARSVAGLVTSFASMAAVRQAVSAARPFNAAIAETSTLIEGTVQEMDLLRSASRQLASDFGGTATSQVQGFYQALSAGADGVSGAEKVLRQANMLAVGGVTDLSTAVGGLMSVVNAYGSETLSLTDASDALFIGMQSGVTTVGELAANLGKVTPLAAAAGVGFDEVVAATAALTKGGISTSEAVTGLRAVLAGVTKPSKEASDLAKALGLNFSTAGLESKGFAGFMEEVAAKTGGSNEALAMLFGGVEAIIPAMALAGKSGDYLAEIMEQMASKAGATEVAFGKISKELDQRMTKALGAIGAVGIGAANSILAAVVPAIEKTAVAAQLLAENMDVAGAALVGLVATQIPAIVSGLGSLVSVMGTAASAARALGVAMALAGGPIGIVLGLVAGGAAYWLLFKENAEKAGEGAGAAKVGVDAVNASLGVFQKSAAPSAGQAAVNLASNFRTQAKAALDAAQANVVLMESELNRVRMQNSAGGNVFFGRDAELMALEDLAMATDFVASAKAAVADADARLKRTAQDVTGAMSDQMTATDAATKSIETNVNVTTDIEKILAGLGSKAGGSSKAVKSLADEIQKLEFAADPVKKYAAEIKKLDALLDAGLSARAYRKAVEDLNDELVESIPLLGDLTSEFGKFVSTGLSDFKGFVDGVWKSFQGLISDLVTTAARNRIVIGLGLAPTTAAAEGLKQAGGGAMSGILGNVFGSWGAGGTVGSGFLGGLRASLGGGLKGIFSIGANAAKVGGGIAASLGAALPAIGLLGVGIAAFVGKTKELDRGFQLTVSGMDSMVESFRTIERTRFFGLSKKIQTPVEAASADIADPITAAIAEMQGSVVDVAAQLGIASDAFSNFGASLKVSTAGMSPEEATRALQEALAGIPDQMAAMALAGHDLAREGETAFVTMQRLGSELTVVNAVLSDIGQTAYQTSLHGAGMAASLVEIMGGIDAFRAASARFYEVAYTESERLAIQVQRAEDALSSFGAAMPKSRAEYRLMVEATDLASERGRALYATLVGLADVFDQVLPAAQSLTAVISSMIGNTNGMIEQMVSEVNAVARAAERAADDWFRAADSLRDLIRDITGSRPGEEGIRALQRAMQAQFQAAKGGDVDAARAFVGTSQSYLAAARDQASTLFDARKAEASVLRQANFLAGISELEGAAKEAVVYLAEQQLGVLQELSDYLQNAETIRPEDIASFESRLGSLQAAIEQAQMFSYDYLQERLNVTVDLIPTADIPPDVAQLMEAAVAGIESSIDFAVRAQDLTPDLRWLAVTAASEHLKTIEFLIANDLPDTTRKLALMDVSLLSKTINFIIGQDISHEDKALALATSSELSRLVNVVLASGADAAAIDLALGNIASHTVTIEAKLSESSELREFVDLILGSSAGKITLGGSFQFDPSAAFSQWFSGTTAAHIVQPMTDLRASLNDLRAAVTENNHRLALQMADAVAQAQAQAVFSQRSAALENLFQTQMRTDAGDLFLDTSQVASVAGMLGLDTSQSAAVLREQIAAFSGNDSTNRVLDTTSTLQGYLWDAFRSNVVPVDPADYLTIYPDVATNSYFRTRPAEHYAGSGRDEILTGQRGFDPRAFNWNAVGIHIPGFAAGGMHAGGFRVVGENGPELEYTPPSRIYSAPQTSRMLDTTEVVNEIRALRAEVAQLRSENTYLLGELEDHAYKSRRTQESWDRIGLPPERTDA